VSNHSESSCHHLSQPNNNVKDALMKTFYALNYNLPLNFNVVTGSNNKSIDEDSNVDDSDINNRL